jgi:hypothetical protein
MSIDWEPKHYVQMTTMIFVVLAAFIVTLVAICSAYGARNLVHQEQIDNRYIQACQPLSGADRVLCLGQYFSPES